MVQILLLRFRCSVLNKMTRLWLASATLLCFAVTVLKCEELNSYESGMCNKLLINREYNNYAMPEEILQAPGLNKTIEVGQQFLLAYIV